jgi:nucleoside-diphosphate-sugar epimerase
MTASFSVLITGGSGFIGRHLIRRLQAMGCSVHVITRQISSCPTTDSAHSMNLLNSGVYKHLYDKTTDSLIRILEEVKPYVVVHLASLFLSQHTSQNLDELIGSNILFGTQLLEAMDKSGSKFLINTGTSWQHYENSCYSPVNLYAATKQAFEDIALYYCQAKNFSMITLSLYDTYGPGDTRPKLLPLLKRAAQTGEALNLSPGDQQIDLVHVDDVVDAFVKACQRLLDGNSKEPEVFAISSNQPISLKSLVKLYSTVTKKTLNVIWGARPYRDREVMVPWNTGVWLPGWMPQVELAQGLKDFDESAVNSWE